MTSHCRSCGAEIEWREVETRFGLKFLPFDVGTGVCHFKTCPDSAQWRNKEKAQQIEDQRKKGPLDQWIQ